MLFALIMGVLIAFGVWIMTGSPLAALIALIVGAVASFVLDDLRVFDSRSRR